MARPKGSKNLSPRRLVTDEELLLARKGLPPHQVEELAGDLLEERKRKMFGGKRRDLTDEDRAKAHRTPKRNEKRVLAKLIKDIGDEVVDPEIGWTRMESVIRRLYNTAIGGSVPAAELLMERGWGKVATPIEVDVSGEVRNLVISAGLTWAQISADPVLRELLESSGITADELMLLEAPKYDGREDVIEGAFTESEVGPDSESHPETRDRE